VGLVRRQDLNDRLQDRQVVATARGCQRDIPLLDGHVRRTVVGQDLRRDGGNGWQFHQRRGEVRPAFAQPDQNRSGAATDVDDRADPGQIHCLGQKSAKDHAARRKFTAECRRGCRIRISEVVQGGRTILPQRVRGQKVGPPEFAQ
jgi:hypothetical protein